MDGASLGRDDFGWHWSVFGLSNLLFFLFVLRHPWLLLMKERITNASPKKEIPKDARTIEYQREGVSQKLSIFPFLVRFFPDAHQSNSLTSPRTLSREHSYFHHWSSGILSSRSCLLRHWEFFLHSCRLKTKHRARRYQETGRLQGFTTFLFSDYKEVGPRLLLDFRLENE